MKNVAIVIACGLLCAACGGKVDELKKNIDNMQQAVKATEQVAKSAENLEKASNEAEEAYKARAAKGDTIAMPYKDLQGFIPESLGDYKKDGDPTGSQQNMSGFSYSTTTQKYTGADGSKLELTLGDWGGTQGAYGMASMASAMNFSSEDDNQRIESLKMDVPQTGGIAKFDKHSKETDITIGTRYRYIIELKNSEAKDDQTKSLVDFGTEVAKKFDGK